MQGSSVVCRFVGSESESSGVWPPLTAVRGRVAARADCGLASLAEGARGLPLVLAAVLALQAGLPHECYREDSKTRCHATLKTGQADCQGVRQQSQNWGREGQHLRAGGWVGGEGGGRSGTGQQWRVGGRLRVNRGKLEVGWAACTLTSAGAHLTPQ